MYKYINYKVTEINFVWTGGIPCEVQVGVESEFKGWTRTDEHAASGHGVASIVEADRNNCLCIIIFVVFIILTDHQIMVLDDSFRLFTPIADPVVQRRWILDGAIEFVGNLT